MNNNTQCYHQLVKNHYPHLEDDLVYDLLIETTCFPFGDYEAVEKNLIELIENTDGTLEGAMEFADNKMKQAWIEHKARSAEEQN